MAFNWATHVGSYSASNITSILQAFSWILNNSKHVYLHISLKQAQGKWFRGRCMSIWNLLLWIRSGLEPIGSFIIPINWSVEKKMLPIISQGEGIRSGRILLIVAWKDWGRRLRSVKDYKDLCSSILLVEEQVRGWDHYYYREWVRNMGKDLN